MHKRLRRLLQTRCLRAAAVGTLLVAPLLVTAGTFPDLPDTHPHSRFIEALVQAGAVKGYPDGTFRPEKTVQRDELLKIAYVATGRTPAAVTAKCFPDATGTWGELYICDAAKSGFVQGYVDGTFQPANAVTRAEGTKMILEVLGVTVPNLQERDLLALGFIDVSPYSWYARYLFRASVLRLFPEDFLTAKNFFPDRPLTRSEVAAIVQLTRERGHPTPEEETGPPISPPSGEQATTIRKPRGEDDYGSSELNITALGPGTQGLLEKPSDSDWFALSLTPGQSVLVEVTVIDGDPRLRCSVQLFERERAAGASLASSSNGTRKQCAITIYEPTVDRVIIAVSAPSDHTGSRYGIGVRQVSASAPPPPPRPITIPHLGSSSDPRVSYGFTTTTDVVLEITMETQNPLLAAPSCSLYLLSAEGFPLEDYACYAEGSIASLRVALRPGRHQLDIAAQDAFTIEVQPTTGDGNDGLREARNLSLNIARSDTLSPNDYQDWFRFSLTQGGPHEVRVNSGDAVGCLLLPGPEVDLQSFVNPACNAVVDLPAGSYSVAVLRTKQAGRQQTYSIILR